MATAAATLSVYPHPNGIDNTQRSEIMKGTCALSAGGTYATNGIPIVWTFLNAFGYPDIPNFSATTPSWATFISQASGLYDYWYDKVHNTLRIKLAGVELANGAAITADTIGFRAEFNHNA